MTWQRRQAWSSVAASLAFAALLSAAAVRAAEPATATQPEPDPANAAAIAVATQQTGQWLAGIDAGKFDQSWSDAGAVFKEAVTQKDWTAELTSMREKLGNVLARKQKSADYSRTLRGAPTGDYVTVVYDTRFEKAPPVIESLAVAKEADGQWRIVGYDLSRAPDAPQ